MSSLLQSSEKRTIGSFPVGVSFGKCGTTVPLGPHRLRLRERGWYFEREFCGHYKNKIYCISTKVLLLQWFIQDDRFLVLRRLFPWSLHELFLISIFLIVRSTRSVEALTAFVKQQLASSIQDFVNKEQLEHQMDHSKRNIIAYFAGKDSDEYRNFQVFFFFLYVFLIDLWRILVGRRRVGAAFLCI